MLSFNLYFIDQPYTSHELPPLVSSCTYVSSPLLSHPPPPVGEEQVVEEEPPNDEFDLI
jgi:hypothetical protein